MPAGNGCDGPALAGRVVFTGGGTGGHVYPALTVLKALRRKHPALEFTFVGTSKGFEARVVPPSGIPIRFIRARGLARRPDRAARAVIEMGIGWLQSFLFLRKYRPRLIVGSGGYVSAPVVFAGALLDIPSVILEQNVVPGKTSRFLSRWAARICAASPESTKYFPKGKTIVTGNPVREEILTRTREEGRVALGLNGEKKCILVTGASQGARTLNEAVLAGLPRWKRHPWQILHLTGEAHYNEVRERAENVMKEGDAALNYRPIPFLEDIANAYAVADLVVARGGATTLAEITARGIAALIVPYPFAAEGHQERNARWLEAEGAARILLDKDAVAKLPAALEELLSSPGTLELMAANSRRLGYPRALDDIVTVLEEVMKRKNQLTWSLRVGVSWE